MYKFFQSQDMAILVTGGCGYVGGALTHFLLKNSKENIILFDINTPSEKNSEFIFIQGDITSKRDVLKVFQCHQIKAVLHVAGFGLAGTSNLPAFNQITKKVNVEGTKNVIDACLKFNVKALGML